MREHRLALREAALQHQIAATHFGSSRPPQRTAANFNQVLRASQSIDRNPVDLDQWDPAKWSHDQVASWVTTLGNAELWQYEDRFRENHVSGRLLLALTDQHLRDELAITSFGHRMELLDAIKALQKSVNCGVTPRIA